MKSIYVVTSKIEGLGINAGEDINPGEVITRFRGPVQFKINKNKKDALAHPDWVGIKKNHWIDPEKPQKFFNHSCEPNASIRGLTMVAIRKIKEGEEITFDYSIIEGDTRWEMLCLCGKKNCRKLIQSVQFLPKKSFNNYLPYIPAYFRKVYAKYHQVEQKA